MSSLVPYPGQEGAADPVHGRAIPRNSCLPRAGDRPDRGSLRKCNSRKTALLVAP